MRYSEILRPVTGCGTTRGAISQNNEDINWSVVCCLSQIQSTTFWKPILIHAQLLRVFLVFKDIFCLSFPIEMLYAFVVFVKRLSHSSWYDHHNNTGRKVTNYEVPRHGRYFNLLSLPVSWERIYFSPFSFIEADQVSHPQKHESGSRNHLTDYELVPQSVREVTVKLTY
jgi:hypothetical protein